VAKRVGAGPTATTFWLHTDRLGSIQATTDTTGQNIFRRTYRPYGETIGELGSHVESRGWIDQRNDPETGLTYLHARYYDSQLGVFLSPDPIGVQGGLNLYGFGLGNPISNADRTGLDPTREGVGEDKCRDWTGGAPAECQGPWDDPFEFCLFCDDDWRSELPDWIQNPIGPGWRRGGGRRENPPDDGGPQPPPNPCLENPTAEGCPGYVPPVTVPVPNPPGSGSIVVSTNPYKTNPGGVFSPRDPNDLLRSEPPQAFNTRFALAGWSETCEDIGPRFARNFIATNRALPGLLAPTGTGMILGAGRTVAEHGGRVTLWQGVRMLVTNPLGGSPFLGAFHYVVEGAGTSARAGLLVGGAFELGVAAGSLGEALYHQGTCH
jgi:RHS repeat-associated protein